MKNETKDFTASHPPSKKAKITFNISYWRYHTHCKSIHTFFILKFELLTIILRTKANTFPSEEV